MSAEKQQMHPDTALSFGCAGVLVALVLSCTLSSVFRAPDMEAMNRCAEACGPSRMTRYTTTTCECADEAPCTEQQDGGVR